MMTMAAKVVGARDGKAGFLGSIGVRFMIDGGAVLQGIDASLTSTACSRKHNDVFRAYSAQVSCGSTASF